MCRGTVQGVRESVLVVDRSSIKANIEGGVQDKGFRQHAEHPAPQDQLILRVPRT